MGFNNLIYMIVRQIPAGRVATYKQIAALAGKPGAARAVGNALHKNPYPIIIPCHRVVNSKGEISQSFAYGGAENQRRLLLSEGVVFLTHNKVDLSRCRWVHSYYSYEKSTRS